MKVAEHILTVRRLKAFHEGKARKAMEELLEFLIDIQTAQATLETAFAELESRVEDKH